MSDPIEPVIGLIGGSGLYDIDGLEDREWRKVETPWGEPSDQLLFGRLDGVRCVFLPRHGRGHPTPPSELNYRANIDALKRSGVHRRDLALGGRLAAGGPAARAFRHRRPVHRPHLRPGEELLRHAAAWRMSRSPIRSARGSAMRWRRRRASLALPVTRGGTYLVMEGPQFSTKAESELYRAWGCSVIGMTNMPEAKLAREAELCYATVAMVTDFDCWHPDHDHVTVDQVVKVLFDNADKAKALVKAVVPVLGAPRGLCPAGCDRALDHAIITAPEMRDPALLAKLDAVAGRLLA